MVGFDAKNKGALHEKFICVTCKLILRDPIQINECGHRLCQSCINVDIGSVIKCSICHEETQRTQVMGDRAVLSEMQSLLIVCALCSWSGIFKNYQSHISQSHRNMQCEYCGKPSSSTEALNQHMSVECSGRFIDCPLKRFGCITKVLGDRLRAHYLTPQHHESIINVICILMKPSSTVGASLTTNIPNQSQEIPQRNHGSMNDNRIPDDNFQNLYDKILQLPVELREPMLDFVPVQLGVQESTQSLNEGTSTHLNQEIDTFPNGFDDGTLVWRINNIEEKMLNARSERQTSIYSPPFYSSTNGYKMRARLYLNGDGNARGTHMSLFFVLMRSKYDAILKFPFSYKVTFCLLDQTGGRREIIDSFRPDKESNSFQRPRSEMNIASGIPKFAQLDKIEQEGNPYVRADTMFIKVMVDFGDIPQTLLPFAMGLNSGFPTHVQDALIKEEAENRRKEPQS